MTVFVFLKMHLIAWKEQDKHKPVKSFIVL